MENRVYSFEGVQNFRDFGGYRTQTGGQVKTGKLFRSAQFGEATEADMAKLDSLNIKLQADLRRADERERHGHRWPIEGVHVLYSDKGTSKQAPHVRFLTEVSVDAKQAEQWMIDYYIEAPFREQHVDTFSDWFQSLSELEDHEAAVVNCAAGKDRTGILCALTLNHLGVDRKTIFEDYELTNTAAKVEERLPQIAEEFNRHIDKNYASDVYRPFIGVRKVYLEKAYAAIEQKCGTIEVYLKDVLNLEAERLEKIRVMLID